MKKSIVMLLLVITLLTSGCTNSASTNAEQENSNIEHNEAMGYDISSVNEYMKSVEEQSSDIKYFLENEAMTQLDMNEKSKELYELWDGALNYLWGELKTNLPEEAYAKLLDEQRAWIVEKEDAIEEAGKDFEGGSMYPLVINSEGVVITEKRVYELYEILKQID